MRIEAEPIPQSWNSYNPEFISRIREQRMRRQKEEAENRQVIREMVEHCRDPQKSEWWKVASLAYQVREWKRAKRISTKRRFMRDTLMMYCFVFNISPRAVLGKSRNKHDIRHRHYLIWLLYLRHPEKTPGQIGEFMNRDRTTILAALKKYKQQAGIE